MRLRKRMSFPFNLTYSIGCIFLSLFVLCLTVNDIYAVQRERITPVVKAVNAVAPAVVNITSTLAEQRSPSDLTPFDLFFGLPRQNFQSKSIGSGIIIDGRRALVLTNAHVVNGASSIAVKLLDGRSFNADVVGAEADFDIAVLRLKSSEKLPSISMGDSTDLMPGETVIAIGNPFGFSHTVTTGVVSALNRTIEAEDGVFTDLIQTDSAINPGNSGGPLLNILGELIGINTAIYGKAQGIGFAIPISKARRVVDDILERGKVKSFWLGLLGQDVDPRTAHYLRLPSVDGLLVTEVFQDGPAWKVGLKPGDVIRGMAGNPVSDREKFQLLLRNHQPGTSLTLKAWSEGKEKTFNVVPSEFTDEKAKELALKRWGIAVRNGRACVMVSEVRANSPAKHLGLEKGDGIAAVSGRETNTTDDFLSAFRRDFLKRQILLQVIRRGRLYQVVMTL